MTVRGRGDGWIREEMQQGLRKQDSESQEEWQREQVDKKAEAGERDNVRHCKQVDGGSKREEEPGERERQTVGDNKKREAWYSLTLANPLDPIPPPSFRKAECSSLILKTLNILSALYFYTNEEGREAKKKKKTLSGRWVACKPLS